MSQTPPLRRRELAAHLAGLLPFFVRTLLIAGLAGVLLLTPTIYMLQVYDRVVISRDLFTLISVTVIALSGLVGHSMLEHARSTQLLRVSEHLTAHFEPRVFQAAFAASVDPSNADSAARALPDFNAVRQFLAGPALMVASELPWTPIFLAVLYLLHPLLCWSALGMFALQFAIVMVVRKRQAERALAVEDAAERETVLARGISLSAETASALGMLPALRERWLMKRAEHRRVYASAQLTDRKVDAISDYARQCQQSLLLGAGAWLVVSGELTLGGMVAANMLAARVLGPAGMLVGHWGRAVAAWEAFLRLERLLARHATPAANVKGEGPLTEGVVLQGYSAFVSGRDEPILQGIDFQAQPGTVTALIGPSGSGKSTLARALVGAWPDASGRCDIQGRRHGDWDTAWLSQSVGYLPQDIQLFEGSVAQNIARFQQVDPGAVIAAARAVGLHEVILRLPAGYDTPAGTAGQRLNAGLRQRIALARALYRDPGLVVLDEPDAHLDETGTRALRDTLMRVRTSGCAVVVVTHRPALLDVVDTVVVLERGRIRLAGTVEEVRRQLSAPSRQDSPDFSNPNRPDTSS